MCRKRSFASSPIEGSRAFDHWPSSPCRASSLRRVPLDAAHQPLGAVPEARDRACWDRREPSLGDVVDRCPRPCGIDRMRLRPLHVGSLENLPFFGGRQLPRTPCRPASIMLCGGGHISPLNDLAVFFDMPYRVGISAQDEPRSRATSISAAIRSVALRVKSEARNARGFAIAGNDAEK
jgi:hypothetical protein